MFSAKPITIKRGLQMNLFAIGGVVCFVLSVICLAGAEITFKEKTGAGIVSIVIAYVIWSIRGAFEYWWITAIAIAYVVLGIILILYEPIHQWHTTKRIKIEEIIELNKKAKYSLACALIGVISLIISTKV